MIHTGSSTGSGSGIEGVVLNQPRLGAEAGGAVESTPRIPQAVNTLASMPVILHVRVPLTGFRLQALARLQPGSIVSTTWPGSDDLPVSAGGVRIAWAEFAVTDLKRSVRVTRIS